MLWSHLIRMLCAALVACSWGAVARAEIPSKITVILRADASQVESLGGAKEWSKSCKSFAKAFTQKQGPWGFGIVTKVSCTLAKTDRAVKFSDWTLVVRPEADKVTLSLHLDGSEAPLATSGFKVSQGAFQLLAKSEFASLIALDLMEQLPMLSRLGKVKTIGDRQQISVKTQPRFIVFTLRAV